MSIVMIMLLDKMVFVNLVIDRFVRDSIMEVLF